MGDYLATIQKFDSPPMSWAWICPLFKAARPPTMKRPGAPQPSAAALYLFVRRLHDYEPNLVQLVGRMVPHFMRYLAAYHLEPDLSQVWDVLREIEHIVRTDPPACLPPYTPIVLQGIRVYLPRVCWDRALFRGQYLYPRHINKYPEKVTGLLADLKGLRNALRKKYRQQRRLQHRLIRAVRRVAHAPEYRTGERRDKINRYDPAEYNEVAREINPLRRVDSATLPIRWHVYQSPPLPNPRRWW